MLTLTATTRIFLAAKPTDLRKGFDGLCSATRHVLRENPLSGHLFVFYNRRRNRMKVLVWQPSGFLIAYKRFEHGTFRLPATRTPPTPSRTPPMTSHSMRD